MTTLIEDIQEGIDNEDPFWRWTKGIEILEDEIIDERRWYVVRRQVLRRDGELVAVEFCEGSTETQDTELNGEVYAVQPVEVTVTRYEKVETPSALDSLTL